MAGRNFTLPLFGAPPMLNAEPPGLRPYQAELIKRLRALVSNEKTPKKRILVVGPCSMGKMVVIAAIMRTSTHCNLFAAHREELIEQCASQLQRFGVSQFGVMRGDDERTDPRCSTQIASVATLNRRDRPFVGQPTIIYIDEAHLSASDMYRRNLFEAYPDAIILGFTATPARLDGQPLGELYEHMEIATTYEHLLKNPKWLMEPVILGAPHPIDVSRFRKAGSDYDEAKVTEAMDQTHLIGDTVGHWLEWAHRHPVFGADGQRAHATWQDGERRRTLVFAVSIAHSLHLAERFEKAGARVAHVDGTTKETERKGAVRAIEAGELDVLCNVNVFGEGFDCPPIKCVAHCCPTLSLVRWRQSTQRCMRPWNGITPMILDHGDNMGRHFAPHEDIAWSLQDKPRRMKGASDLKSCAKCHGYSPIGRHLCPHCGAEFSVESRQRSVAETGDRLAEYASTPEAMRAEFFEKQLLKARTQGFKPGYPAAKFFERYGVWPPRPWNERAKAEFAGDTYWIAAVEQAQARRAAKKAREAEETAALAAETQDAQEEPTEAPTQTAEVDPWGLAGEGDFSSYLEGEGIV